MNSKFLSLLLSGMCFSSLPLNCSGAEKKIVCFKDARVEIDIFNLDASEQKYENHAVVDSAISKLRKYLFEMNLDKVMKLKAKENEYLCGYYGKGTTIFVMNDVGETKNPGEDRIPMAVVGHIVGDNTFIIDTFYCYYQIIQHINDPYFELQGNCQHPRPNVPEDWIIEQCVMFCEDFPSAWKRFKPLDGECNDVIEFIDYDMAKVFCNKKSKVNEYHIKNFFETFLSYHKQIKRIVLPDTNPNRTDQRCYAPLDLVCKSLRSLGFNNSGFDKKDNTWFLSIS